MNDVFKTNLYLVLQQIALLFAGALAGVVVTEAVTGWGLTAWQDFAIVVSLLILLIIGLGYWFWFFLPWKLLNKRLDKIALLSPYGINDTTSSWVDLSIDDITGLMSKSGIKFKKTNNLILSMFYPIIVNPYGGAYPEQDLENFTAFRQIRSYVKEGGVFVNIADIPFYFARTKEQHRLIDTTPLATPTDLQRSFLQSLLTTYLNLHIWGTDYKEPSGPERIFTIVGNLIDLYKNKKLKLDGSPYIALPYGRGFFVFSTLHLGKDNEAHLVEIIRQAISLSSAKS